MTGPDLKTCANAAACGSRSGRPQLIRIGLGAPLAGGGDQTTCDLLRNIPGGIRPFWRKTWREQSRERRDEKVDLRRSCDGADFKIGGALATSDQQGPNPWHL